MLPHVGLESGSEGANLRKWEAPGHCGKTPLTPQGPKASIILLWAEPSSLASPLPLGSDPQPPSTHPAHCASTSLCPPQLWRENLWGSSRTLSRGPVPESFQGSRQQLLHDCPSPCVPDWVFRTESTPPPQRTPRRNLESVDCVVGWVTRDKRVVHTSFPEWSTPPSVNGLPSWAWPAGNITSVACVSLRPHADSLRDLELENPSCFSFLLGPSYTWGHWFLN